MLTKARVIRVAQLARLDLSESEVESFGRQLSIILESFIEISKIDTDKVEPLLNPTDSQIWLRADQIELGPGVEPMLANAPERSGNLIKVPRVVG